MKRSLTFLASLSLVTCALILSLALPYTPSVHAQNSLTLQQLFGFACDPKTKICPDGANPSTLIQASDGNFYGSTLTHGGSSPNNLGTIFKINPNGQLQVIYTFAPAQNGNFPNGEMPNSLVEGDDGFLYGTALGGTKGPGVVFRLSKAGVIQIIHNFCSQPNCADGSNPHHLMLAADGSFYGDTLSGLLFRISSAGAFTVLHTFSVPKGEGPSSLGLAQASDGNFYGTTLGGGTIFTTLFRLTPSGTFTVLHTFHYAQFPVSAPIQASDGKLYAAWSGGTFTSNLDGSGYQQFPLSERPLQPIIQASDGNLWAGIFSDSNLPNGGILSISPNGAILQSVPFNGTNGFGPDAPLIQNTFGTILGVTDEGGSVSSGEVANGAVFTLNAGLAAPKPTLTIFNPSSANVGSKVIIYGDHLLGTTRVTFNSTSAAFRVLNVHTILATVPAGATTGPVAVTNAGGTSTSNKSFTVH